MKKEILILFLFLISSVAVIAQNSILAEEAINHIGKTVTVCGNVSGARYLSNTVTRPTLINMGGDFPNHALTILIRDEDRRNFSFIPEERYINKNICVTGTVIDYKGKPEIIVSTPSAIVLTNDVASLDASKEPKKTVPAERSKERPTSTIPTKKDTPAAAPLEAANYTIEITSDVNLREGPSIDTKSLMVVKAGTPVNIYKSGNGWSYVSIKQDTGSGELVFGYMKNSVIK